MADFRYQLTVIGAHGFATVEREIENNTFTIRTSQPNAKVSWQVTGIRQDAAARPNLLPVEEQKPVAYRGTMVDSEYCGAPEKLAQVRIRSTCQKKRHLRQSGKRSSAAPRDISQVAS
jgi:hypothetical protein